MLNFVEVSGVQFRRLVCRPFCLFCTVVTNQLTIDCQIYAITFKNWELCFLEFVRWFSPVPFAFNVCHNPKGTSWVRASVLQWGKSLSVTGKQQVHWRTAWPTGSLPPGRCMRSACELAWGIKQGLKLHFTRQKTEIVEKSLEVLRLMGWKIPSQKPRRKSWLGRWPALSPWAGCLGPRLQPPHPQRGSVGALSENVYQVPGPVPDVHASYVASIVIYIIHSPLEGSLWLRKPKINTNSYLFFFLILLLVYGSVIL